MKLKTYVLKIGGSNFSTDEKKFDFEYFRNLRQILVPRVDNGHKFILIVGGGKAMRDYKKLVTKAGIEIKDKDLHWIGLSINTIHAFLAKTIFPDLAAEMPIVQDEYFREEIYNFKKSIVIGGGGAPGYSSDMLAVRFSERVGVDKIISLKSIGALYDKDPNEFDDAKIVKKATWDEYADIIGGIEKHEPGGNYPVDPVTSRYAKSRNKSFVIINGSDFENLDKVLEGKNFEGSVIE